MTVQQEIFEWVQEFDPWKQELFIRAAAAPKLGDDEAEEIADMLLGSVEDGTRPREIKREDLPEAEGADRPMVIDKITDLRNVNAIEDGQTLAFESTGVNVVWGANGAGKTGYSRVLKKAGRTLYPEEILTNVYKDADGGPSATVVVRVGDEDHTEKLDLGAESPALLGRICIADARAGEIYLQKETEVDYVPTTLASVSRLASGLGAVRAVLQKRRDAIVVPQIDLRPLGEGTRAANFLAGLDAGTSEADLRSIAQMSEDEMAKRTALRKRMGEIESAQAPHLRAAAEREGAAVARLRDDLGAVAGALDAKAIEIAAQRQKSLQEAREAADLVAKRIGAEPLGEIGSQPWRLLWEAAHRYATHLGQVMPPDHDPAHCPLCMQELGVDARKRLQSFERFVADDVNAKLARLEEDEKQAASGLPRPDVVRDRHQVAIALLGTDDGDLGAAITSWLDLAEVEIEHLRKAELSDLELLEPPPDPGPWIEGRNEEIRHQAEIESGEGNEKARTELAQLEGRYQLGQRLEDALARLAAMKERKRLENLMAETATTAVSRKIGALSQTLISDGLQQALKGQLEALEFRELDVVAKTRTVKGQPMTQLAFKTVESVPLTAVLSHGEQRRLALAMFLAEMEVRADSSPVIFDDPTSSIDQEGRRRIARTLLKLGEKRQVIVFTHELSLVVELQRYSGAAAPVFSQHVKRIGKTVGHVYPDLPWDGLSPKERHGYLDQKLIGLRQEYEKRDEESYAPIAEQFCKLLRSAFERTVEERVLEGVIQRRGDSVHTTKLRNINWSVEICDLVDRGVDENSPWVHDQPLADGASPPGPDELSQGLDVLAKLLASVADIESTRRAERDGRKRERRAELKAVELLPSAESDNEPDLKSVPDSEPSRSEPEIAPRQDGDDATPSLLKE